MPRPLSSSWFPAKPGASDGTDGLVTPTLEVGDHSIRIADKRSIIEWHMTHETLPEGEGGDR